MKTWIFVLALLPFVLHAEEPTTEPVPPSKWANSAELSLLLSTGNTEVTTIGLGTETVYEPKPWTAKAKVNYLTNSSSGVKTAELLNIDGRGDRDLTDRLSTFVQAIYFKNRFAGFENRLNGNAGLSYLALQESGHKLTTDLGAGVVRENRTDDVHQTFATVTAALKYTWQFAEKNEFGISLIALDNLKLMDDWRLSNVNSLTTMLTQTLSLRLSYQVEYLKRPVAGKRQTDTTTLVTLVAKF